MITSDEIKTESARIVKAGIERGCSPEVIAQAVYDHVRLSDPLLAIASEIVVQLKEINQNIQRKELVAQVNLYESEAGRMSGE